MAALATYVSLIVFNSVTRTRRFSQDSMNYVDVARNISLGRGVVQSTPGFNDPHLRQWDGPSRAPLVSQPPLYPLLIALISGTGIEHANVALMLSAVAYGLAVLAAYRLARDLCDRTVALLSAGALLLYAPLGMVSRFALTDSLGLLFVLLSLWFLVRSSDASTPRAATGHSFAAGLAAGLAFGTRYALLPLTALGMLFLHVERRRILGGGQRAWMAYASGACLPIAAVLVHNVLAAGQLLSTALPSDLALLGVLRDAALALVGSYSPWGSRTTQAAVALGTCALSVGVLLAQRRSARLLDVFVRDRRYLVTSWVVLYVSTMVCQRALSHFDRLEARIMLPAGVALVILGAALILEVLRPARLHRFAIHAILALTAALAIVREVRVTLRSPPIASGQVPAQSDRYRWVAQHSTPGDLIVGDDTMDIPFFFKGREAVSFSAYPYTIHVTSGMLGELANRKCGQYDHIYLLLRRHEGEWSHDEQIRAFGDFIAGIKQGRDVRDPGVRRIHQSKEIVVCELVCGQSAP